MKNDLSLMRYAVRIMMLFGLSVVAACHSPQPGSQTGDEVDLVQQGVTITSYNYTDRALNDITVDGVWAGGARAYSFSGRAAGLLAPKDRSRQHSVKVRWDVGSKYDLATNRYPDEAPPMEPHEVLVPIKFPYPQQVEHLILHFYPDGHVEAELTESMPEPRIPAPEGFRRPD